MPWKDRPFTYHWSRDPTLDVYSLAFALFALLSPWLFAYGNKAARVDFWTSGALIALISLTAILAFSKWQEWLNLVLGIWLATSPWLFGFLHTRAMHLSIAVGGVITFLAGLELWLDHYGTTQ